MTLVVFPFKEEAVSIIAANLAIATRHTRVREVWAVSAGTGRTMDEVAEVAAQLASGSVPVRVFPQERLGTFRPGKGDGMNTAIRMAAERGFERTHFYDADITNFDPSWIDGAETAADRGFEVVRHGFPRAATDAMVTWMITRPSLARLFPGTILPRIGQPLGGELALNHATVTALAEDPFVVARSDWGIDTLITHATTIEGEPIYEHNVADGKRHALYGSLTELRPMVVECLDAVRSLRGRPSVTATLDADPPADAPADLKTTVGYDEEATLAELGDSPGDAERVVLESLGFDPGHLGDIDENRWGNALDLLLADFRLGDPGWESAVFRLWAHRVLHYTRNHAVRGYDHAMAYLEATIRQYETTADHH
jgi:mannosylglycerate synthase